MTLCDQVQVGRNTIVRFSTAGANCRRPSKVTITITDPEAASALPQTLNCAAVGVGVDIPAGDFIEAENPTTGAIVMLQLASRLQSGDTEIDVTSVPQAIADNSTIEFPFVLKRRTGANINDTGNMVNSYAFEDGGYEIPKNVTREVPVDLGGDYVVFSAAFQNFRNCALNGRYGWLEIEDPKPSDDYSSGEIIHGLFAIGNVPKNISSTEITKSDLTGKFVGGYTRLLPVPII